MKGGFSEYDDGVVQKEGSQFPSHDITPDEYLFGSYLLNKTIIPNKLKWRCNASTSTDPSGGSVMCNPPEYNSVGFLLLGYVLAAHYNATTWDAFDYKHAAIPAALRRSADSGSSTGGDGGTGGQLRPHPPSPYDDGLIFFTKGKCSEYPNVAHYYNFQSNTTGTTCTCSHSYTYSYLTRALTRTSRAPEVEGEAKGGASLLTLDAAQHNCASLRNYADLNTPRPKPQAMLSRKGSIRASG